MDHIDSLRRFYELINDGDVEGAGDLLADDFIEHEVAPGLPPTKTGSKELFTMMIAAFPDLRFDAEDLLADGNKVVGRAKVTGTNTGSFMGMPATGKAVNIQAIDIVHFGEDGLALEHWGVMDMLSMMQQLGLAPAGPPG
jgi:steroid delta-isomerase-like uncharacterized protein